MSEPIWPQPGPRWVPVEERLPESGVDVLVFLPEQSGIRRGVYVAMLSTLESLKGTFSTYFGFGFEATHWMPLPYPPTDCALSTREGDGG